MILDLLTFPVFISERSELLAESSFGINLGFTCNVFVTYSVVFFLLRGLYRFRSTINEI